MPPAPVISYKKLINGLLPPNFVTDETGTVIYRQYSVLSIGSWSVPSPQSNYSNSAKVEVIRYDLTKHPGKSGVNAVTSGKVIVINVSSKIPAKPAVFGWYGISIIYPDYIVYCTPSKRKPEVYDGITGGHVILILKS